MPAPKRPAVAEATERAALDPGGKVEQSAPCRPEADGPDEAVDLAVALAVDHPPSLALGG
jgi:hypothetical protein